MRPETKTAKPEDAAAILGDIYPDDLLEIQGAIGDRDALETLEWCIKTALRARTLWYQGEPKVLYGIHSVENQRRLGSIWALRVNRIPKSLMVWMMKNGQRELDRLLEGVSWSRVFNVMLAERTDGADKFLRGLGFTMMDQPSPTVPPTVIVYKDLY